MPRTTRHMGDTPNPLKNTTLRPSLYNAVQLVCPGLVFVPIRIIASVVFFLLMWACAKVVILVQGREALMRRGYSGCSWVVLSVLRGVVRVYLFILGFYWVSVDGEHAKEARILVANHVSWMDYMVLSGCVFAYPISRVENLDMFIVGAITLAVQSILVDREDPDSREKVLQAMRCRAHEEDDWPHPVVIFPEGTCHNQTCLMQFQQGAFKMDTPVQPVALRYGCKHHDISWAGDANLWTWLIMFSQWVIPVSVHYGKVVRTSTSTTTFPASPIEMAHKARRRVAKLLHIPVTEYTSGDTFLQKTARRWRIPCAQYVAEMGRVKATTHGIKDDHIRRLVNIHCAVSVASGRTLSFTLEGWCSKAGFPTQTTAQLRGAVSCTMEETLPFKDFVWCLLPLLCKGVDLPVPDNVPWLHTCLALEDPPRKGAKVTPVNTEEDPKQTPSGVTSLLVACLAAR